MEKGKSQLECGMNQLPVVDKLYPMGVDEPLPFNQFLDDIEKGKIPNNQVLICTIFPIPAKLLIINPDYCNNYQLLKLFSDAQLSGPIINS